MYINILNDKDIDNLTDEVRNRKDKYLTKMNAALINILNNPILLKENKQEIKRGFNNWYKEAENHLQPWAESIYKRTDLDYKKLPHIRLSLYYFFAKHYQATVNERKFRASELYDRAYFIESFTLGTLVTDDGDLQRTASIIPNHGIKVHDLAFFIQKYMK